MFRIDDATAAGSLPAPEAAGTEGYFTEGNPATNTPATKVRGSWLNMIQEELRAIVVAAGLTPSKTTYNQVLTAIQKLTQGAYSVRGLTGKNNATTPNSQADFAADVATLRNPTSGATVSIPSTGIVTNNVLTAGPSANGRDQAAAFAASNWIHFYWIWNGTTLATISSLSAPPTGPTLPSGYTHWGYLGAWYYNASSQLVLGYIRGSRFYYQSPPTSVSSGSAVAPTVVNVASLVPPNALDYTINILGVTVTTTAGGQCSIQSFVEIASSVPKQQTGFAGTFGASTPVSFVGPSELMPNVGQQYLYVNVVATGTSPQTTHTIGDYKMPNGGE
ncbi:hypothetical protein [Paraburkholderia azotifigens]|uniref:hypothetical protein n=1 Tax=Paraburkholderia azotifigens TaxID=2057004 RepID=UPI0038BA6B31